MEQILGNLEQLLHKNHYHCFTLKHSLIQLYGRQPGFTHDQLSEDQLQRKIGILPLVKKEYKLIFARIIYYYYYYYFSIGLCKDLLEVTTVFDRNSRRLALYTTVAMFELHLALLEVYNRKSDMDSKVALLTEAQTLLSKCTNILADELPFSAGYEMNNLIKQALSKVNKVLEMTNRPVPME